MDSFLKITNIKILHLRIAQIYGDNMRSDRIIPIMKNIIIQVEQRKSKKG